MLANVLYIIYYCNNVDRQEQEQLDVQIDIDESLIREREERIRQIEVSPLQQEQQQTQQQLQQQQQQQLQLRTDSQTAYLILFGQFPAVWFSERASLLPCIVISYVENLVDGY